MFPSCARVANGSSAPINAFCSFPRSVSELIGSALAFTYDQSPEVQSALIPILIALCKCDPSAIEPIARLAKSPREQQTVLVQVVQEIGPASFHQVLDRQGFPWATERVQGADELGEDEESLGRARARRTIA
jgi:hypothetical protein